MRSFRCAWAAGALVAGCIPIAGCAAPPDMSRSAAVGPYARPMPPPSGVLAAEAPSAAGGGADAAADGAELYRIYCAVCHGSDGGGAGVLADYYPRMPDLTAPHVGRYPAARLETIVRRGGFRMPAYADALSADERRAVVAHVRTLGDR